MGIMPVCNIVHYVHYSEITLISLKCDIFKTNFLVVPVVILRINAVILHFSFGMNFA